MAYHVSPDFIELQTVAPAATPVSLAEVKAQCRVDDSDSDDLLNSIIDAATRMVEKQSGKSLITQTWQVQIPSMTGTQRFFLPQKPAQSITSIGYYDADNVSQSATLSDFEIYKHEDRPWIEPKATKVWPSAYSRRDALTITYVTGYGDASSDVPSTLRHAILLTLAHWFENREAVGIKMNEIPLGASHLIDLERTGWIAA